MKSLKTIQVLAKIGYILSKIVFICSVVGAVLCAVCLILLPVYGDAILRLGDTVLYSLWEAGAGKGLATAVAAACAGLILSTGEAITAKFAEAYFRNELLAGTPFTHTGAHELSRLGILSMAMNVGCSVLAAMVQAIVAAMMNTKLDGIESSGSLTLGIVFLVLAVIFRYGAELTEATAHQSDQTPPTAP